MRRFDCEKRLEKARIPIIEVELPERIDGIACQLPRGGSGVLLRPGLGHAARRCVITHEYYHLALFPEHVFGFHDVYASRMRESTIEHRVRTATADHLVSRHALERALRRGEPLGDVADDLGLTLDVLDDAIALFARRGDRFFQKYA